MINFILGFIVGAIVILFIIAYLEPNEIYRNGSVPPSKSPPPKGPPKQSTNQYNYYGVGYKDNSNLENMKPVPPPTRLIKDGAQPKN